jgi:hypothetical protein
MDQTISVAIWGLVAGSSLIVGTGDGVIVNLILLLTSITFSNHIGELEIRYHTLIKKYAVMAKPTPITILRTL